MLELRDLRTLIAVEEERHFGKAAEKLGVTQSAISKSIQRFEALGISLFDRSRSQVMPTVICEALLTQARLVLSGVDELDKTVRQLCGLETGSLGVGIGPAMSETYVTEAITRLAVEHPGIQIDVRVDHWRQLSSWLVSGEIDLFVADLADVVSDSRFRITPLPEEELTWFCRAGHPLAKHRLVSREQLLEYPLATPSMPPWAIDWFHEVLSEEERETSAGVLPTIRCENYSMLRRMVLESDCISVALMDSIGRDVDEGHAVVLSVEAVTLKTNAGIVQLNGRAPAPLANAFVDRLVVR